MSGKAQLADFYVDEEGFRKALERYVKASSRETRIALADKLVDWCDFALKRLRGSLGATHDMVAWPKPGHRGNANRNWRLVRWLATRQIAQGRAVAMKGKLTERVNADRRGKGKKRKETKVTRIRLWVRDAKTGKIRRESLWGAERPDLAKLAEQEQKCRNSSKGYVKSLVLAAFKAAKAKTEFRTDGGIVARQAEYHIRDQVAAGVQSVMKYRSDLSRAMVPRTTDGIDTRLDRAFELARADVVLKIERHLAKKLEDAMKKSFKKALA